VEVLLPRGQLGLGAGAAGFQGGHHRLQALDQGRHQGGLLLQQPEGFGALVRGRMGMQAGGDLQVEPLHRLEPLAPAQRRKQAEHR